jgi:hypothetical protein
MNLFQGENLRRIGVAILPLHYGKAPPWLFGRMVKLSKSIATIIVNEYGQRELLERLADPFWFQAFGNVLGYDWHSSGLTTVTMGALKQALKEVDLGIKVAGGKGLTSRKTPEEIKSIGNEFSFSGKKIEELIYASRISAKVDNAVLQDGYQLYHHTFIISERGDWTVIQQGMNEITNTARRYHWLSFGLKDFINEPHAGIITEIKHKKVIDLTSKESEETRKCSLDLVREGPKKLFNYIKSLQIDYRNSLLRFFKTLGSIEIKVEENILKMPKNINWDVLEKACEIKPKNYEELISIKGLGPGSIRALALVSHLIYGTKLSWKDPPKYSFAHGGKDGVPYPVKRSLYDKTIEILEAGIKNAEIGKREQLEAIRRLKDFLEI